MKKVKEFFDAVLCLLFRPNFDCGSESYCRSGEWVLVTLKSPCNYCLVRKFSQVIPYLKDYQFVQTTAGFPGALASLTDEEFEAFKAKADEAGYVEVRA